MPIFEYTAIDNAGNKKAGTVDARSKASAVSLIKKQGLFIVDLKEEKDDIIDQILSVRGVSDIEVVAVTRQLATMISSGLPIARGLEVLANQTDSRNLRKVLLSILRDVESGSTLAASLSKFPNIFSKTYIALVRAGEESGKLEKILLRLADKLESQREFKANFKSAMIYPIIVFIAMIGVFILMMVMVIPKLSEMYESLNVELPKMTQGTIAVSNFMVNYWYIPLVLVVGLVLGVKSLLSTEEGKTIQSLVLSKTPIFGKLIKQKDLTEFSRTISLLTASGIPITESLEIVSEIVTNPELKKGSLKARNSVEKGGSLAAYLRQDPIFPPLIGQMVSVGEETGKLDEVLSRVGDYFAGETEHAIEGLSSALEPVILIVLGAMVGLLIVSIITPIYKITSSI